MDRLPAPERITGREPAAAAMHQPDRVIVAEAVRGSGIAIDAAIAPGRRHHGNQRPAVAVAAGEQVRARNQGHVVSRDAAICPVAAGR